MNEPNLNGLAPVPAPIPDGMPAALSAEEQARVVPIVEPVATPSPGTARELYGHAVNDCNKELRISVLDAPGQGGACHLYDIRGFNTASNPSCPFTKRYGAPADHSTVLFQNGPIGEVGVNGITHEALLAILIDRCEGFQAGPYACPENAIALSLLKQALNALHMRTKNREKRGVEGTHQV